MIVPFLLLQLNKSLPSKSTKQSSLSTFLTNKQQRSSSSPSPSPSSLANLPMKPEAAAFLSSLSSSGASPSSSSRREHPDPTPAADSPGCMAGILRIVSKYHSRNSSTNRRRRFLTFRRHHSPSPSTPANDHKLTKPKLPSDDVVPRSPTIQPEIRRSPGHNHTTRQALVARLMGLEDGGGDGAAADQRRKLLGALEKCDEDLKALKEMIDEVKKSVGGSKLTINDQSSSAEDLPSDRLQLLSEFTRPVHRKMHASSAGGAVVGIPRQQKKKPGDQEEGIFFFDSSTKRQQSVSRAAAMISHHRRSPNPPTTTSEASFPGRRQQWSSNDTNNNNNGTTDKKAMAESVERACSDIEWGQRREVGRIGLALQDQICKDLVEEFVAEVLGHYLMMNKRYSQNYSNNVLLHEQYCYDSRGVNTLPFDACKRSLRF